MFSPSFTASTSRNSRFVGAYHEVGVQTLVSGASPHGLVALLFDGFVAAVQRAKGGIRSRDVSVKGKAIGHAVRIIDEGLKAALDMKAGGTLASDLADLYAYICMRLTQANLRNDEAALDECLALISPLREAWQSIGDRVDGRASN